MGDQIAVAIDASNHFVTSPLVISTNYFLTSKNGCLRGTRYGILSNGVNPASVNPFSIWTQIPLDSPAEPFDESNDTSAHRSINNRFASLSITEIRKNFVGEHYWHWRWQWSQFDLGKGQAYGDAPMFVWVVPYWSIVIPLTLTSLCLLAVPRRTIPTKRIEPAAAESS